MGLGMTVSTLNDMVLKLGAACMHAVLKQARQVGCNVN